MKRKNVGLNITALIDSLLSDRSQRVVLNGVSSDSAKMISGVPQGSVLGPLLYIIYINDLSYVFSKNVTPKLFADDAKLYTVVETQGDVDDLQESINKLSNWATNWQLKIAFDKCNVIDFATKAASRQLTILTVNCFQESLK